MAIEWLSSKRIQGLSTDTKPTNIQDGTEFRELDTDDLYIISSGVWSLVSGGGSGASAIDDLTDVDTTTVAPSNNDVLTWNSTDSEWVPAAPPGASGGEANTYSSTGTGEGTITKTKTGVDLPFKSLKQGTNITLTNNADDVTITSSGEANTSSNVGTGEGTLAKTKVGTDLPFKSLKQGTNITLTNNTNDVTIASAYPPDASDVVKGIVELSLSNGSESGGGRAVQDNDTRLTDARTPTAHVHSGADITSGTVPAAQLPSATNSVKGAVITSNPDGSESAGTKVILDNDPRLTDSRTPIAHNHNTSDINAGTLGVTRGGTGKSTITQHSLLKGGATNTIDEIAPGTNDHVLAMVSGTPAWKSLDSERTGKATASGNGSTTQFTIAHGLGATPSYVFIDCSSHSINRTFTVDGTNITVTFASAPSSGTNNVIIYWRVIA